MESTSQCVYKGPSRPLKCDSIIVHDLVTSVLAPYSVPILCPSSHLSDTLHLPPWAFSPFPVRLRVQPSPLFSWAASLRSAESCSVMTPGPLVGSLPWVRKSRSRTLFDRTCLADHACVFRLLGQTLRHAYQCRWGGICVHGTTELDCVPSLSWHVFWRAERRTYRRLYRTSLGSPAYEDRITSLRGAKLTCANSGLPRFRHRSGYADHCNCYPVVHCRTRHRRPRRGHTIGTYPTVPVRIKPKMDSWNTDLGVRFFRDFHPKELH